MKLLKSILKSYLIYSGVILIVSIPLSYFITRALCLQDVDEALQNRKKELIIRIETHPNILNHLPWNDFTKNTIIYPSVAIDYPDKTIKTNRYNEIRNEKEPYRELHSFIHINNKIYPITLRVSLIGIEDLIQGIVLTSSFLIILILGGLFYINRRQSRRIWKPFEQILNQLRMFDVDQKPHLAFISTDFVEFKELQQTIMSLSERVHNTYLQQKEFTGNAAHELQTPLATIQSRLELMMQDQFLTENQSKHLEALSETVVKMTRLNKELLLLTKIENEQFIEKKDIEIIPLLKKVFQQAQYQIQRKKIDIKADYTPFTISANASLTGILLSNLIINALRYSPSEGIVEIKAAPSFIEIKNDGLPLSFPQDKLFERFQKSNLSNRLGGNGLGLAIVKKICDTCNYHIEYHYTHHRHCFTLNFQPHK